MLDRQRLQGGTGVTNADSDARVVDLWLFGKCPHTQRAYRADVEEFLGQVGTLRAARLEDVQGFASALSGAASSRARRLSAVKSLLGFAHRIGYLPFDVGAAVQQPRLRSRLSERILSEREVLLLIEMERDRRNRLLLEVLYYSGCRLAEICGLRARDVQRSGRSGQITVFGKGGKTRSILLPANVFGLLEDHLREAQPDAPVFRSQKGRPLSPNQVERLVKKAATRAGLSASVSPHWLRHAHASHALDRGAPSHLVQTTLGHASLATTSQYAHARPSESSGLYLRS